MNMYILYTHMHTYVPSYIHTYLRICIHTYMYTIYMYTNLHVCMYTCVSIRGSRVYLRMCVRAYVRFRIHTLEHISYIHSRVDIHINTYMYSDTHTHGSEIAEQLPGTRAHTSKAAPQPTASARVSSTD